VSLGNPENSTFLKQLIKFMTEKAAKGVRPIEAFNISATRFSKATYETFAEGTARIEGEKWWDGKNPTAHQNTAGISSFKKPWRYGNEDDNDFQYRHGDTITAENFNATLGGAQISGFLLNEELVGNPYDDPWFTTYVLEYYSNIKIDVNGQYDSYDYDIPEELQIDKTQTYASDWNLNYVNFVPKARGYTAANETPLYGQGRFVGIFETEDNISTYDEFFKDRIAPIFFGAYSIAGGATIGPGKQDNFNVPNLCKLFMEHLGESPSFEDDTERRLFLLMGGQYYGENDLEFMNLMGSTTRDTTSKYNVYDRHPPEVLAYWQKHYEKAVAKEGPKNVDSYKVLEELIGSPITKKTFAHFITHGAPTSKPWANKVFPITTYDTKGIVSQYSPFVTTLRVGPSLQTHALTLVFRKYKFGQDNYRLSTIGETYGKDLSRAERKAKISDKNRLFYEIWDLRNKSWAVTPRSPTSDDPSFGTDQMAGNGSYLNNWPVAPDVIDSIGEYNERALGTWFMEPTALTTDYRKAFAQTDVPVLPEESVMYEWMRSSKPGYKRGRNAGPQNRGESVWNGELDKVITDVLDTSGYDTEKNREPYGPYIDPWIEIDEEHTILDFNPANNMSNLMDGMRQAVLNDLPGPGGTTFSNYFPSKDDHILGKQIFEPLSYAMQCLTKEWEAFEERVKWYETQIKNNYSNKDAASQVTLYMDEMPDAQDSVLREYYILQIWLDSVNSAAVKVNEWLRHQQTVTQCVQRFAIVLYGKRAKMSNDEIKAALETEGIAPGKVGLNANTPFEFDLPSPVPDADDDDLDPEEIKELLQQRAKNIDQCLLLTNLEAFRDAFHEDIIDMMAVQENQLGPDPRPTKTGQEFFTIHRKKTESGYVVTPFGDRFHMLGESGGRYHQISNILIAPDVVAARPFMDLTPELQAALVPKIRLFRVTDNNGKEVEKEFIFENFVSTDEIKSLRDASTISRGRGGGIKSFNWSYEGTTPATAKKDINAELVLFFQSFDELTRTRGQPGKEYKYIDLLLYPTNTNSIHPNEYQPANFRIRADVGWQIRDDRQFKNLLWSREVKEANRRNAHKEAEFNKKGKKLSAKVMAQHLKNSKNNLLPKMKKALETVNKTFLLNKIDHEIDFRNDGTVELRITYAAYAESVSKTAKVNALSTPQIEFFRASMQDELKKLLDSSDCRVEEIDALRIAQARREEKLIKAAQGSIVKRLKERGLYRSVAFNRDQVNEYLKSYSTSAPKPIGDKYYHLITPVDTDFKTQKEVGFYFLGDILHTVMDCLYMPMYAPPPDFDAQEESTLEYHKRIPGMERYVPLLSSFIYTDYNSKKPIFSANIADIPISAQYFNEWMVDNVIKSGRTIYPLMDFIKDLLEAAVDLMTEVCINRQIDVSLMFQTTQIRGIGYPTGWSTHSYLTSELDANEEIKTEDKNATKWEDRFGVIKDRILEMLEEGDTDYDPTIINVDNWHAPGSGFDDWHACLPIPQGDEIEGVRVPLEGYYDYNLIYPVSPTLTSTHQGRGMKYIDEENGTYHFHIGLNRGLMKNIKFSKSEMAYLREARYYNQGTYGLLQLGAVHNVDIELFGNTIFYPGMEIFIDPRNFGGSHWDPTVGGRNRSVANQLGIGGYHTITKVESTISPQGYNTKLTALFQYSGDGESRMMAIDGKTITTRQEEEEITAKTPARDLKCVDAVDNALRQTIQVNAKKKAGKKLWKKRTVDYSK
tara:strand:+ start:1270 stop:6429 length:5160 start_codon:yes stop_codon:yes gene_type:complete